MSYTIPANVQTKAEAVLALASTIADADKTNLGDGSVNKALDVLADTLAEQDVTVPNTNAGAILALAQYVSGGGGGSSIGALQPWPAAYFGSQPVVGGTLEPDKTDSVRIDSLAIDGKTVFQFQNPAEGEPGIKIAAGTMITAPQAALTPDSAKVFVFAFDTNTMKFTKVEPFPVSYDPTPVAEHVYMFSFAMPEAADGEEVMLWSARQ